MKTNTLKPFSYSAGSLLSEKRRKGHESLLYDLFERISSYKQALMGLGKGSGKDLWRAYSYALNND